MDIQHKMTSKAQVTIPKDVRIVLGLKPGDPVRFGQSADGQITVSKGVVAEETIEQRRARIRAALEAATGVIDIGMSTDEFMKELRGDWEP
jgi:antitoxin PrlF